MVCPAFNKSIYQVFGVPGRELPSKAGGYPLHGVKEEPCFAGGIFKLCWGTLPKMGVKLVYAAGILAIVVICYMAKITNAIHIPQYQKHIVRPAGYSNVSAVRYFSVCQAVAQMNK